MIIKISEIESGVSVKGSMDGSRYREEGDEDIVFLGPVRYDLAVMKRGSVISVTGTVACELSLRCSKCLEEFSLPVESSLDIEVAPKTLMPSGSEVELRGEDLDIYYYEGDEVDLDPFIYEEIMLDVPIKPVCRETCKGLCDTCGANRNYEECRCNEAPRTLLGEKLKSFLN